MSAAPRRDQDNTHGWSRRLDTEEVVVSDRFVVIPPPEEKQPPAGLWLKPFTTGPSINHWAGWLMLGDESVAWLCPWPHERAARLAAAIDQDREILDKLKSLVQRAYWFTKDPDDTDALEALVEAADAVEWSALDSLGLDED